MEKTLENIIHYLPDYKGVTIIFGGDTPAENEVVERKTPNSNVSIKESVNPKEVNERLDSILGFSSKTIEAEYETRK